MKNLKLLFNYDNVWMHIWQYILTVYCYRTVGKYEVISLKQHMIQNDRFELQQMISH